MTKKKLPRAPYEGAVLIQLNLIGVLVFSAALVATSVLVTYGLVSNRSIGAQSVGSQGKTVSTSSGSNHVLNKVYVEPTNPPPWGQFIIHDIDLEQPEEYLAFETNANRTEHWTFEGMTPTDVRSVMQSCGVAPKEIDRALSSPLLSVAGSKTVVAPDNELLYSLSPQTRTKLYAVLARFAANEFMQFPFRFVGNKFEETFGGGRFSPAVLASLKKLLYPRGDAQCFSDWEMLLKETPDVNERLHLLKILSRQTAVTVRVLIWPDTDVDKLLGYWNRGIQAKDIRPLLESLKRLQESTTVSILYFLPQFARQRLYTYPVPGQPGDPAINCHWSTMNFFNETPDNRFSDPAYTVEYLKTNYYTIARPTAYGDIIFILNKNGDAIHSAVYLAEDIVFTKNGNNFARPWMLMHLKDLIAQYTTDETPATVVYRNKTW
jgi:hypothetical protein